jgi:hypothetical protein
MHKELMTVAYIFIGCSLISYNRSVNNVLVLFLIGGPPPHTHTKREKMVPSHE